MIPLLLLVTICIIQDLICVSGTRNFGQERVVNNLLQNYKDSQRLVRPEKSTEASIGLTLHAINNFDEKTGRLKAIYWFKQSWTDARIAWEDKAVTQILLPVSSLWKPDFKVWNTLSYEETHDEDVAAIVHRTGHVVWMTRQELQTSCRKTSMGEDVVWECVVKIGPWTQNAKEVSLELLGNDTGIDISFYEPDLNGWQVEEAPATMEDVYRPCCEHPYSQTIFPFKLRKIVGGVADAADGLSMSAVVMLCVVAFNIYII